MKCLEPEAGIWGVHFPAKTEEPAAGDLAYVLLDCERCFSREIAALTAKEFRGLTMHSSLPRPCRRCQATTGWTPTPIEAGPKGSLPGLLTPLAQNPILRYRSERGHGCRMKVEELEETILVRRIK